MKQIVFLISLLVSLQTFGQNELSPKKITKKNYIEVIGDYSQEVNPPVIDRYAMYPDGRKGMLKHIGKNVKYPEDAYNRGIQGKVELEFIVEKDGSVQEVRVIKSVGPELDQEAIRVIKKMNKWVPGYVEEQPIRLRYTVSVNFQF